MNYSKSILIVDDNVKVVKVSYDDSANNDKYFKTLIQDLEKDALVVIPTNTRAGFTVGRVKEVGCERSIDLDDTVQINWIAQTVDKEAYERILQQEAVAVEQIKSAELREKKTKLLEAIKVDKAAIHTMLAAPAKPAAA